MSGQPIGPGASQLAGRVSDPARVARATEKFPELLAMTALPDGQG